MSVRRKIARRSDRFFDRIRHAEAFSLADATAVDADFAALRGHKYALLVTHRRDGSPVPTPVWFARSATGSIYVQTTPEAGKVKRLRHDSRVLIAPSTMRGKPCGSPIRATAKLLPEARWAEAERALAAAYGPARRIFMRMIGGAEGMSVYLEITPGH